jgi:hypothetical protein
MHFLVLFLIVLISPLLTDTVSAQSAHFYPLEMVKPGQKGFGKTVFSGTQVENFDVEILGVLHNIGPKQNLILARLSGEKLSHTGVFAGMSGSPVYLENRLVGAVAYAFSFAKEPFAGITPIQEMVDIFKERPQTVQQRSSAFGLLKLTDLANLERFLLQPRHEIPYFPLSGAWSGIPSHAGELRPISTPVNLSGFSQQSIQYFTPYLNAMGMVPVRGMASGRAESFPKTDLEPGATISVGMVRGDMDVSASGTLTHISGDRIYAFGHPFLSIGYTDMPLNKGAVLAVIPSLMSSQKVSATTEWIGSIRQDRSTGIMGMIGERPRLIPVRLRLQTSRNETKEFNYEIVNDPFLTPFLMAFSVHNAILSSERSIGGQTLQVRCQISLLNQPDVNFENSVSDLASSPALAAISAAAPVNFLLNSGFEDMSLQRINLEISAIEQTREATLEKIWQDKLEVRAGEEINLTVFLRKQNGETVSEKYPVKIPPDVGPGPLKIAIADGRSLNKSDADSETGEFVPDNLRQLIRAINNIKKNDRLYIRIFRDQPGAVVGGEGLPDLPPSLLALYRSEKTSGDVKTINKVIYVEHELPSTQSVLKGQHVIRINVKG